MEITSYLLGKKAGGGGEPPVYQDKEVTITQNGETRITADNGYDALSSVEVTTNVPGIIPTGTIEITQNGTGINVSSYATADVNVPSQKFSFVNGGGFSFKQDERNNQQIQAEINNIIANVNMTSITSMNYMFNRCPNLTEIDLSNFDTSNVNDMSGLFLQTVIPEIDLSNFNTSNVTAMTSMFSNNTNLISVNVSNFNTSNVTTMNSMFSYCNNNNFNTLDLSSFYTPKLTDVSYMFYQARKLTRIDMRNFDFTNVVSNYNEMFGSSATVGVPNNCLIIVKDNTAKTWITSKFSRLTNVKTVEEYEG